MQRIADAVRRAAALERAELDTAPLVGAPLPAPERAPEPAVESDGDLVGGGLPWLVPEVLGYWFEPPVGVDGIDAEVQA